MRKSHDLLAAAQRPVAEASDAFECTNAGAPQLCWGAPVLRCVRRCPTFPPGWVVSSALAGLASGFGMGPGVSLPLWTAVTVFTRF